MVYRWHLLYCVLFAANGCASRLPLAQVEPLQGVDSLRVIETGQVEVYAQRGIGRVHIVLPAGERLELFLHYAEGRPMLSLEGLVLSRPDGSKVEPGALWERADNRVHLLPQKKAAIWHLLFVDFYR